MKGHNNIVKSEFRFMLSFLYWRWLY